MTAGTTTVRGGRLGHMQDVILEVGATLSSLVTELRKHGVDGVEGCQAFIDGARVGDGVDPVLTDGAMVTFNGKLKGN